MDLRKETKISCSLRNGGMLRQVASLLISCIATASLVFVLLAGIKQVHKNAEKSRKGINSTSKNDKSNFFALPGRDESHFSVRCNRTLIFWWELNGTGEKINSCVTLRHALFE